MIDRSILVEYEKLDRQHAFSRWIWLFAGAGMVVFSFYVIGGGKFDLMGDARNSHLLAPLGGWIVGYTLANWSGSRSLKLLKKVIQSDQT